MVTAKSADLSLVSSDAQLAAVCSLCCIVPCVCQLSTELVNNQRQGARELWTRKLLRHLCTTAQGALQAAPVHRSHLISGCAIVFDTASFTHIHIECLLLSLQFSLCVHYPNEMGIYYAVYRLAVCVRFGQSASAGAHRHTQSDEQELQCCIHCFSL